MSVSPDTHVIDEDRADLVSHLTELRTRLVRSLLYLCLTATVASFYGQPIYRLLAAPVVMGVKAAGGRLNNASLLDPFMLRVWLALLPGLIAALPLIYLEVWGFVKPGLTKRERRVARPLAPIAGVLFVAGAAMAYALTKPCVQWMVSIAMPGTERWMSVNDTVVLLLKFYVTFGLCFQLPLVMIALSAVGLVNSGLLLRYWREATIAIFLLVAIVTPTWDPFTMTLAALPVTLLYLGTIGVIRLMERRRRRARREEEA